jgi:hypothetical protein
MGYVTRCHVSPRLVKSTSKNVGNERSLLLDLEELQSLVEFCEARVKRW